jgi:hypothetical protein
MVKLSEIREEMNGRIQARSFWDEIEKIGAAKKSTKERLKQLGIGAVAATGGGAAGYAAGHATGKATGMAYEKSKSFLSKLKKFVKK